MKQDHCKPSFSKQCGTYGQFCEGTDCHSYVWPGLEQSWLSLGTVDARLTFQQSCFKKINATVRIAWHFMSEKQFVGFESSNKPSTSVSSQSLLNSLNGKDEGTRRLRRQAQTFQCTYIKLLWVWGGVTHMLQGFGSEAQIQLLEAHTQAGNHRRRLWDRRGDILYLLPEGGKCEVAGRLTLACFLISPGAHLLAIFRHECILKIKRDALSLCCLRNCYMHFGNMPECNLYAFNTILKCFLLSRIFLLGLIFKKSLKALSLLNWYIFVDDFFFFKLFFRHWKKCHLRPNGDSPGCL